MDFAHLASRRIVRNEKLVDLGNLFANAPCLLGQFATDYGLVQTLRGSDAVGSGSRA